MTANGDDTAPSGYGCPVGDLFRAEGYETGKRDGIRQADWEYGHIGGFFEANNPYLPDAGPDPVPCRDCVNHTARVLMTAWEQAEGKPVTASYVATFADMARAALTNQPTPHNHHPDPM